MGRRKRHFTADEDRAVARAALAGAEGWVRTTAAALDRDPRAVAERWRHHLDPAIDRAAPMDESERAFVDDRVAEHMAADPSAPVPWTRIAEALGAREGGRRRSVLDVRNYGNRARRRARREARAGAD